MNGTKKSLKEKLLQHKDSILRNQILIKLKEDVPLALTVEDLSIQQANAEILGPLVQRLEFKAV